MKDTRLLEIFNQTKKVLCQHDYYIHTPKRILHLTNTELKLPHLMGLQYVGKKDMFTGDYGAYAIKKGRVTMPSIEKLVRRYYDTQEKQDKILKMIHLKLDYLYLLDEMFSSYTELYLFDINHNPNSGFDSDYLMVHSSGERMVHLGLVLAKNGEKNLCHCNSFMTTFVKERDFDILYRDLEHQYKILKIVREDKITKKAEVIYQSSEAECRERSGIEKMLAAAGISSDDKLVTEIIKVNLKFGKYHVLEELADREGMLSKCGDKREEAIVTSMYTMLEARKSKREENSVTEKP